MAAYDVLRILRKVIPHNEIVMGMEDVIYWASASIGMFYVLYTGNDGIIRLFAIGTMVLTMLFYNAVISRFTVPILGKLLRLPIDFTVKLLKIIGKKVKIKSKVRRLVRGITGRFKRAYKKRWLHGKNKRAKKEKKEPGRDHIH